MAELVDISREAGDCPLVEYGVTGSGRDEFPPPLVGSLAEEKFQKRLGPRGHLGLDIFIDGSGLNPEVEWQTRSG
eukprot:8177734-Pyramimonas_sp.AAC.1